jgi:hypothetical protein
MLTYLASLPVGNAVRGLFTPPAGAVEWRVLRKTATPFTGVDDPDAVVAYDRDEHGFVDITVANGQVYFYLPYYLVEDVWVADAGGPQSVTPVDALAGDGPDVAELVRVRLEAGLKSDVAAARIAHKDGFMPVLSAPPVFEDTTFPIVTVHLEGCDEEVQGVGGLVSPDAFDLDEDAWRDNEGGLFRWRLLIVGWTVANPDARGALRLIIQRRLLANRAIFEDAGMTEVTISTAHREDFDTYGAPVYQSFTTLTCLAPLVVDALTAPISDVTVTAISSLAAAA